MVRVTGQVLCEVLRSPKGFIPSVLSVNLMLYRSSLNRGGQHKTTAVVNHQLTVAVALGNPPR
jgi:hypothetical protein